MKFWVAIFATLCSVTATFAQSEGDSLRYKINPNQAADSATFIVPDIRTWHPSDPSVDWHSTQPKISMTSPYAEGRRELPSRVFIILPNNTLEAWGRVNVSNGQAQNWGPYPNSYLDARTLSFPIPR